MKDGINVIGYIDGGFGLAKACKYFIKALQDTKYPHSIANISVARQIDESHNFQISNELPYDD